VRSRDREKCSWGTTTQRKRKILHKAPSSSRKAQ
jgi:hypothetical protein